MNVVSGLTLAETAGDLAIAAAICSRFVFHLSSEDWEAVWRSEFCSQFRVKYIVPLMHLISHRVYVLMYCYRFNMN